MRNALAGYFRANPWIALLGLTAVVTFPSSVAAQTSASQPGNTDRRWEVEVHGGGASGSSPTDGTASVPGAGEAFTTLTGRPSRRASSWYFGDGAALMNAINASFGILGPAARVTPLDSVLASAPATRSGGGAYGFRVGYAMTPRLTVAFNLDSAQGTLKFTDALRSGVEASRASFIAAWNGLISTGGGVVFTSPSVTSTAAMNDEIGKQLFTTGSVDINLMTGGRIVPYAAIGAGVVSHVGDLPSVTLTGNYRFTSLNGLAPNAFPVNETDTVTLRVAARNGFVTVLGGGARIFGSRRWGARADLRAYISKNTLDWLLDSSPQVATGTPAGAIASTLTPSIQFSDSPSTGRTSTLSGPSISDFSAFTGSGSQVQFSVTAGYFVRF